MRAPSSCVPGQRRFPCSLSSNRRPRAAPSALVPPSPEQITGAQPIVERFPARLSRCRGTVARHRAVPDRPYAALRAHAVRPATNHQSSRGFLVAAVVIVVLAIAARRRVEGRASLSRVNAVPNLVGQTTKQASTAIASDGSSLLDVNDVDSRQRGPTNDDRQPDAPAGRQGQVGLGHRRERLQGSRHRDVAPRRWSARPATRRPRSSRRCTSRRRAPRTTMLSNVIPVESRGSRALWPQREPARGARRRRRALERSSGARRQHTVTTTATTTPRHDDDDHHDDVASRDLVAVPNVVGMTTPRPSPP